jgi:hypothetical protein
MTTSRFKYAPLVLGLCFLAGAGLGLVWGHGNGRAEERIAQQGADVRTLQQFIAKHCQLSARFQSHGYRVTSYKCANGRVGVSFTDAQARQEAS